MVGHLPALQILDIVPDSYETTFESGEDRAPLSPSLWTISRQLPHEILAEILGILLGVNPDSWRTFTQISIHLRDVALSFPELWSHVELIRPPIASLFLARCRDGPIHVTVTPTFRHDVGLDETLWQNRQWDNLLSGRLHRVKSVWFRGPKETATVFIRALNGPLPAIEVLKFNIHGDTNAINPSNLASWSPEISKISTLKTLSLDGAPLPPGPEIYRNIRHLQLRYTVSFPEHSLHLQKFLDVLRTTQLLETLELWSPHSDWSASPPHLERYKIVELKHLSRADIWDKPGNIVQLLTHLSIPKEAKLSIDVDVRRIDGLIFNLFPSNRDRFSHLSGISSLTFGSTESRHSTQDRIQMLLKAPDDEQVVESSSPLLLLQFLQELKDSYTLSELKVFEDEDLIGEGDLWHALLNLLPTLRKLHVAASRISSTVIAGQHQEELSEPKFILALLRGKDTSNGGLLCPSLTSLEIDKANFLLADYLHMFIEFLKTRKLEELKLSDPCGLNCTARENISQLVEHFDCNKWECCGCPSW